MGLQNNSDLPKDFVAHSIRNYIFMYMHTHIFISFFKAQISLRCGCSVIGLEFKYLTILV